MKTKGNLLFCILLLFLNAFGVAKAMVDALGIGELCYTNPATLPGGIAVVSVLCAAAGLGGRRLPHSLLLSRVLTLPRCPLNSFGTSSRTTPPSSESRSRAARSPPSLRTS